MAAQAAFLEILRQRKVREALLESHKEYGLWQGAIRRNYIAEHFGLSEEELESEQGQAALDQAFKDHEFFEKMEVYVRNWQNRLISKVIYSLVEKRVRATIMPHLPFPSPLTVAEIADEIGAWIGYANLDRETSNAYEKSLDELVGDLAAMCSERRHSRRFHVANIPNGEDISVLSKDPVLWENGSASLYLGHIESTKTNWIATPKTNDTSPSKLYAHFSGACSSDAIEVARKLSRGALRACLLMLNDLNSPIGMADKGSIAVLSPGTISKNIRFLQRWLEAYFNNTPRKKTISRQSNIALHLIISSSNQDGDALSLATGCSALEALLGRGEDSITRTLSENIATFLEPDPNQRAKAISWVKELYHRRSRILHGDALDCDPYDRFFIRALCAHVLRGLVIWQEFCSRMNEGVDSSEFFFKALEDARITGKRFVTCEDTSIRCLWTREIFAGPS